MVVNACNFDLVTVHDSIGSHPSDFFATATAVREQFVAVHSYDVLADLTSSLNVDPINFINKRRSTGYNASEALNSTYIFS